MKPTLLYVSPFWPMKSGISEYSEALVEGLEIFFDITLLVDGYKLSNKALQQKFKVRQYKKEDSYKEYNYILYNFGNSPDYHSYMYEMIQKFSGYIILHDFILYYLTIGYYQKREQVFQKIYELEGVKGLQVVKNAIKNSYSSNLLEYKGIASKLPMNKEVLKSSKGIFVHSQYTKEKVENLLNNQNIKVMEIPFINMTNSFEKYSILKSNDLRLKYQIPENAYIIGSAGYIAPSKQNKLICETIKKYNQLNQNKIYYIMIGEGNCVDEYLDEHIIKTGFVSNEEFAKYILSCDLMVNLRTNYNGEASGPVIQFMNMGVPCVVTDIGWFGELPDNCVFKLKENIGIEELYEFLQSMRGFDTQEKVKNSKKYVEDNCNKQNVTKIIYEKITEEIN